MLLRDWMVLVPVAPERVAIGFRTIGPAGDVDIGARGADVRRAVREGALVVGLDVRDAIRIAELGAERGVRNDVLDEHLVRRRGVDLGDRHG